MKAGEWKLFSGSVLCVEGGLVSSIAAGPGHHHRSGFWQETTFWGRVSEMGGGATREPGITSCRSTTPTLSHSKTFEERNRTNMKKGSKESGGSAPPRRVRQIKVQLAEKNKIKTHVLYGSLIQTETGGAGTRPRLPAATPHLLPALPPGPVWFQRGGGGGGVRGKDAPSGKAVSGSSAGRRGGGGG